MAVLKKQNLARLAPRLQRIGSLFKGTKKRIKDGKEIQGQDLDHFRFEPEESLLALRSMSGRFNNLGDELRDRWNSLKDEFGDYKSIPVLLPFATLDANFPHSNERWATVGGKQQCIQRCDGELMSKWTEDGKVVLGSRPCQMGEGDRECPAKCKASGYLSVIIPALEYPGLVTLNTHSGNDIKNILQELLYWEQAGFDLSKIPFRLIRRAAQCDWHKPDGSVFSQKKALVFLQVDPEFGSRAITAQQQRYAAEVLGLSVTPTNYQMTGVAPSKALPEAVRYSETMEWYEFQNNVRTALNHHDVALLNQIEQNAIATFPAGARAEIDRLVSEARSMITSSNTRPIQVQKVVQEQEPPKEKKSRKNPAIARISALVKLTGHSKDQLVEIAKLQKLPESSKDYTEDQAKALCDAILADWAADNGIPGDNIDELIFNLHGDDQERLNQLQAIVDSIAENQAIEVDAETVDAETVETEATAAPWV